jgi:TRAP-type C4-dicarboxylate transport system substrate-binding protein
LALETGTIDGVVTDVPLFLAFRLYEQAKYATLATFGCVSEGVIMNLDSWKKTPEDLKPLVEEICGNPFRITKSFRAEDYRKWEREIESKGVKFYRLPPDESIRWYAKFQQNTREWVEKLEEKGLPAKKTVIMFYEETKKRGYDVVSFPPEWKE